MSDTPRTNFVAHETGDAEWDRSMNRFGRMMAHACILELELAAAHDALRIANASAVEHVIDRVMYQQRVKAQRDKAREDALEEAAKVCDSEATIEGIAQKCAEAIRAKKECGK